MTTAKFKLQGCQIPFGPVWQSPSSLVVTSPVVGPGGNGVFPYYIYEPSDTALAAAGFNRSNCPCLVYHGAQGGGEYTGAGTEGGVLGDAKALGVKLGFNGDGVDATDQNWPTYIIFVNIVTDWTQSITVTVTGGGAIAGATSLPVSGINCFIPAGTVLTFVSTKTATLTADAVVGSTSLTVSALASGISAGDTAPYASLANGINSGQRKGHQYYLLHNTCVKDALEKFTNIDRSRLYLTAVSSGGIASLGYLVGRAKGWPGFDIDYAAFIGSATYFGVSIRFIGYDPTMDFNTAFQAETAQILFRYGIPLYFIDSFMDDQVGFPFYGVTYAALRNVYPPSEITAPSSPSRNMWNCPPSLRLHEYIGGVANSNAHTDTWNKGYGGDVLEGAMDRTKLPWSWMLQQQYRGPKLRAVPSLRRRVAR